MGLATKERNRAGDQRRLNVTHITETRLVEEIAREMSAFGGQGMTSMFILDENAQQSQGYPPPPDIAVTAIPQAPVPVTSMMAQYAGTASANVAAAAPLMLPMWPGGADEANQGQRQQQQQASHTVAQNGDTSKFHFCQPEYDENSGKVGTSCLSGIGPGVAIPPAMQERGYVSARECDQNCHPRNFPAMGEIVTAATPLFLYNEHDPGCQGCHRGQKDATSRCWLLLSSSSTPAVQALTTGCLQQNRSQGNRDRLVEQEKPLELRLKPLETPSSGDQGDTGDSNDRALRYGDTVILVGKAGLLTILGISGQVVIDIPDPATSGSAPNSQWILQSGDLLSPRSPGEPVKFASVADPSLFLSSFTDSTAGSQVTLAPGPHTSWRLVGRPFVSESLNDTAAGQGNAKTSGSGGTNNPMNAVWWSLLVFLIIALLVLGTLLALWLTKKPASSTQ